MVVLFSERDFKRAFNTKRSNVRTIYKSDETFSIYKQAMAVIRDIQSTMCDLLYHDDVEVEVDIIGKTKADSDNIYKGILDALQGIVYKNDRQVKKGSFENFCV